VSIPVPWSRFAKRRAYLAKALLEFRRDMAAVVGGKANRKGE
jgi:hypothetical protein